MVREPASRGTSGERFGPLTLARVGKEDGRALIVYSHQEREQHEGGRRQQRIRPEQRETPEGRERA